MKKQNQTVQKTPTSTDQTKISVVAGDCEIIFEQGDNGKFSAPASVHKNPKSEFLFEYNDAIMLTDKLVHRQYEDLANNRRITEIYIVRKDALLPGGGNAAQIPLIKIIAT